MTVGELLARISSPELTEWMAYFDLIAKRQARARGEKTPSMTATELKESMRSYMRTQKTPRRKGKR